MPLTATVKDIRDSGCHGSPTRAVACADRASIAGIGESAHSAGELSAMEDRIFGEDLDNMAKSKTIELHMGCFHMHGPQKG